MGKVEEFDPRSFNVTARRTFHDLKIGEVYRLRQPKELLREFDMYEACGEGFAEPTEYVRQMLPVTLDDGAASEAWTYVYNWPVAHLPRIASGRVLEK